MQTTHTIVWDLNHHCQQVHKLEQQWKQSKVTGESQGKKFQLIKSRQSEQAQS